MPVHITTVDACAGCGARAVANGRCEYCGASRVPTTAVDESIRVDALYGWRAIRPNMTRTTDDAFREFRTILEREQLLDALAMRGF